MASAQLQYKNDTKSKTTTTKTTKTQTISTNSRKTTTIQSFIERQQQHQQQHKSQSHHYKAEEEAEEKPSLCSNTEVKRGTTNEKNITGYINDTNAIRKQQHKINTDNNKNNNKTNTTTLCCLNNPCKAQYERQRAKEEEEDGKVGAEKGNSSHKFIETEKSKHDIDTKIVFISQQQERQLQYKEEEEEQQQQQKLWPGTIPEGKCSYNNNNKEHLAATTMQANNAATVTTSSHTDDVVVLVNANGVQWQQQNTTANKISNIPDIDKKFYDNFHDILPDSVTERECRRRRLLPMGNGGANNRTIQQQLQIQIQHLQQQQQQHNNNNNSDDVFIHDYQGIEEFKVQTNNNNNNNNYNYNHNKYSHKTNKNNNITKMPNNANYYNYYHTIAKETLSVSGHVPDSNSKSKSNKNNNNNNNNSNAKNPIQNKYSLKETTKCCQRNVAKQKCCRNMCNYNEIHTTNIQQQPQPQSQKQQHISYDKQQQHQQQRNFSFKTNQIFNNSLTTKTTTTTTTTTETQSKAKQQQQQQEHNDITTTTTTTTKFYRDLQKMSKYLLSLLVIFQMLPLFSAVDSNEASVIRGASNLLALAQPRLPVVAFLEPLPRPTKTSKCDQTFVSRIGGPQNGTFSAPLLHNHKNHSRQCLYTFLAGPGQRVEVIFKTFNLRGNPPDGSAVGELPSCVHEYMDIYSEVQSSEPAELINSPFGGRYCGTIPPRQRISMYRAIAISFFTNKNITTPDLFEGTFRFINASEYEIGIPIAGSPCSYTITPSLSINKTGVLISPTYPGAYPKDMSCTYQFLGESNQRVRLEFRDFDLFFGGPHCPFDYVKIYDGPDNSSALIGTYCGQQRNLVLYSSESSLFVHFFTLSRTANTQNRGFKGIYEFSESFVKLDFIRENDGIHIRGSECDQKILSKKESTGFVLSPNYPYPYIPKTVCRYFIYGMQDAQHLERVRLEFTAFNIPRVESKDKDKETNCSDGYLKIYLKGQETADAYDKFDYELCGNETQRVVSDGPRLAMVFSSGELQGRGFKGKYVFETEYKIPGTAAPDGSCSFTYVSASKKRGELNSPRYPSNYPSDTNCSYLFLAEPNEQVTIVFDHFKIKADGNSNVTAGAYGSVICFEDWLEMYVVYRDNNDRFLGRYCGMTAPGPVESPRGAVGLRITLHTDQENVASGFKARYFFETAKSEIGDCGGNFSNEDSGIITSPNYPAGYKAPGRGMASMACNWLMTARPGYKLSIHFEQFSLEGDPANRGCPAAVLRLWVNVDSDQPPLELCGEKPLTEQWYYISTGQTARISFTTSDKTVGAQGFRIVWTEIQDSGPGPPSIGLLCESTYHFQCEVGYCISDKLRCDGVKNCGPNDNSDELHCITKAQAEDHGVLIITTLLVVSFLICLLCILYHSRRKRRQQLHQLGLHRNAHYDSQTSATGLNSSRRHLQSGGASIAGSLHGINSGNLIIPPAPLPPRAIHQPPHICISGSSIDLGPGNYPGIMINGDSLEDSSTTSNDSIGSIPFLNECDTDNMGHMIVQQGENV